MKKGGGKRKGSGFERTISRYIDVWWECANGTFWRSVNSGGWKEPADIAPRHAVWFPFVIECKFYKNITILDLLKHDNKAHLLLKWWAQLRIDVKKAREKSTQPRIGLLVFKYNRSPIFVAFELDWTSTDGLPLPNDQFDPRSFFSLTLNTFAGGPKTIVIMSLVEFLSHYKKAVILRLLNHNEVNPDENPNS